MQHQRNPGNRRKAVITALILAAIAAGLYAYTVLMFFKR